jgi:hypothetical protein
MSRGPHAYLFDTLDEARAELRRLRRKEGDMRIERLRAQLERAEWIGDIAAATMLRPRIADEEAALREAAELARIPRRKAGWSEAEKREAWGK